MAIRNMSPRGSAMHLDPTFRWCVFDCISHKVDKDLAQARSVGHDHWYIVRYLIDEGHILILNSRPQGIIAVLNNVAHVYRFDLEFDSRFDFGEVKEIVNELAHILNRTPDHLDMVESLWGNRLLHHQKFNISVHDAQRLLQIVGNRSNEVAFQFIHFFERGNVVHDGDATDTFMNPHVDVKGAFIRHHNFLGHALIG